MKYPGVTRVESPPGLAGREKEFALLNVFLWRAMAGQGQVAFITGSAESNSRAFVEGVVSQVQTIHPSLVVAMGECRQGGEALLPFIEIMHLLTGHVSGDLEDNAVSAQNASRLRGVMESSSEAIMKVGPLLLNRFVPGSLVLAEAAARVVGDVRWLEALRKEKAAPKINQERIEEGRLYEEYGDVLVALARRHPLVLGLLDLQWADPGTLALLFHLSRRLKQSEGQNQAQEIPLLMVSTYRPAEIRPGPDGTLHPLKSTLNEIVRYYGQVTIPLDRRESKGKQKKSRGLADRLSTMVSRNQETESDEPLVITEATTTAVPFVEQTNVFVGRSREMDVLQRFLEATLQGKGQVAFVTGEPGAGKSTLIKAFTEQAQKQNTDLVVAIGECNAQTGAGDAYLPFREVLGMLTGDVEAKLAEKTITPDNANRLRSMLRWTGDALVDVGPDLIEVFVPGAGLIMKGAAFLATKVEWMDKIENIVQRKKEQPALGQRGLEQAHLYEQYTNVICKLATRNPLILVLDDMQWSDEASISLLFHLARRISESKIFIIGTFRPNDVAIGRNGDRHPLEQVVTEIKRYNAEIELNLDKRDVATEGQTFVSEYIDAVFNPHRFDPAFKKLIFQRTQGHALFTVELLRSLQERGILAIDDGGNWYLSRPVHFEDLPARVDAVVGERIARLQSELRDILTIASVEGQDFTAQVVARIREMDDQQLATQLTRVLERQHHLVQESGSERVENQRLFQWHFSHTLFQEHLYRDLGEMERIILHRQVGKYLEILYGPEVKRIAVQLSRHFLEAEVYDKAF
ncbi:MAG: ATP-binding cassette domain-containing protein, partial [Chloroflexi bacterium]|nr:ATP-binding cassette domain-containing protein [Chloroflexota bacterium]